MKKAVLAVLLLVTMSTPVLAGRSDGFVPLFNGRNLDGWVVAGKPEGFSVVDGCIMSEGGKGGDYIRTREQYGNYILRLDWMLSKTGNSGVFIRHGGPSPGFIEAQMLAPWTPHRDDLHCTGSIYGHVPANPRPDETTLKWRKMEIKAEWKTITVSVDGVKTAEGNYDKIASMKGFPLTGYIGLQDSHTGAGEWVKFRNIEIKNLDQDPVFLTKGIASSDVEIRRAAYDSAVRLGTPMVNPLLDLIARARPEQRHAAELALERIAAEASAPGAERQADLVREALLTRLETAGNKQGPDIVISARLLGLIGKSDWRTVSALTQTFAAGGQASGAALESLQRIPGSLPAKGLVEALKSAPVELQPVVLHAIAQRKDPSVFSAVAKYLESRNKEVRFAAIDTLSTLSSVKTIPLLCELAATKPVGVREAVVDSLIGLLNSGTLSSSERIRAAEAIRRYAVTDAQKTAVQEM